jgi:putative methyltransferase (TIGR04325 family)
LINVRNLLQPWCPPILLNALKILSGRNKISFTGNYASWVEASTQATGYDSVLILERVKQAMLKVKSGEAEFERDSVCFYQEEFRWPTLACLLAVAAKNDGQLNVLDFGGSLGSFYFQHKKIFSELKHVRWAVVEQRHFVECGRAEAEDCVLEFYDSISDCLKHGEVDVALCSSVLQYLRNPYDILTDMAQANIPFLIIDRTPFTNAEQDRIAIQHVPENIFKASLPVWLFSESTFQSKMKQIGYIKELEFFCDDRANIDIPFKGMRYRKHE